MGYFGLFGVSSRRCLAASHSGARWRRGRTLSRLNVLSRWQTARLLLAKARPFAPLALGAAKEAASIADDLRYEVG